MVNFQDFYMWFDFLIIGMCVSLAMLLLVYKILKKFKYIKNSSIGCYGCEGKRGCCDIQSRQPHRVHILHKKDSILSH